MRRARVLRLVERRRSSPGASSARSRSAFTSRDVQILHLGRRVHRLDLVGERVERLLDLRQVALLQLRRRAERRLQVGADLVRELLELGLVLGLGQRLARRAVRRPRRSRRRRARARRRAGPRPCASARPYLTSRGAAARRGRSARCRIPRAPAPCRATLSPASSIVIWSRVSGGLGQALGDRGAGPRERRRARAARRAACRASARSARTARSR